MKILIIGANSNLGASFSKDWNVEHDLILHYNRNKNRIAEIENVKLLSFDITDNLDSIDYSEINDLDGIVILTAVRSSDSKSLIDSDPEFWKSILIQNVFGTYNVLRKFIPKIKKTGGNIVLFGSNVSRIGLPDGSAYSASKAAIANISRTLSSELGEKNIRINTISPGPIKIDDTDFSDEYRKFRENYYFQKEKEIPLKRLAIIDDIRKIVEYYLFENTYVSGEEIFVTGGKL